MRPSNMTDRSPDPEQFLRQLRTDEAYKNRGHLKVFLGYASGVGKSVRMLDEARRRKERGRDVVVGATQSVVSPEIQELLGKLEVIPLKTAGEIQVMDVSAILRRCPELCVVDGIAYDNPPFGRHAKRWEDVEELLTAGISILASINLQYIAEYRERVEKVTGRAVTEVVPLDFLRSADEIEVVDAPPEMCLRSKADITGPAEYLPPGPHFAQQQELGELREMALLLTADIVEHQLETYLRCHGIEQLWGTQERILVCVNAGIDSREMLESGRRNADRFHGEFYVVHIKGLQPFAESEAVLEENLRYAGTLSAKVEVLDGEGWVGAVLRFAHARGITQIFIRRSRRESWRERLFGGSIDRLIESAEGIDVRVFPQ